VEIDRLMPSFFSSFPSFPQRVRVLALAALLAAAGSGIGSRAAAAAPNILFITLDTTRADRLGCYGYEKKISANIDGVAASGVLFTRAIAQATVTPVSHASIFTGLYPYTHGLRVMHGLSENYLDESLTTLAEAMRASGYETAAFVSAFPVSERFGFQQGFDRFDADFLRNVTEPLTTPKGSVNTSSAQRRADDTTKLALQWLGGKHAKPWLLWLHYFDPHDPIVGPPQELMERYGHVKGTEQEVLRAIYDMEIMHVDDQIGRVLAQIRTMGAFENTIIVIVADHGEGLGDHNWWTHGLLYEEQVRVPLIVRAPSIPAGRRVTEVVRSIDIMPTVLELAGVERGRWPKMDGRSLVAIAKKAGGAAGGTPPLTYCDSVNMLTYQFTPRIRDEKNDMLFSVIDGPWKYIHHLLHEEKSELYNTTDDPKELTNLYGTRPGVVEQMKAKLQALPFEPTEQMGDRERMSPEDIERLRSLGYIDD
jgi:arylsulfatase A-like enzyme